MSVGRVPFLVLAPGEDASAIRGAIARVVASGWFVLGPEVAAFEQEFAAACRATDAVGVGTGTDAIALILRALGIGVGDEVITTPLSAAFSALAIRMAGATPVFADVDPDRLTLDAAAVERAVTPRTRALLPVHLYGQSADLTALQGAAARHGLALVEDCCQAHLGTDQGRAVGTIGVAGAFSFYPTKNLGALGDGGAVITNDAALAERIRRLRNGGQTSRYHHQDADAVNSRLDEMQAAILRARLPFLRAWTDRRRALARRYRSQLASSCVTVPPECDPGHVYHLFVVRTNHRDALQSHLSNRGIETLVHYPIPIPDQPAFSSASVSRPAQAGRHQQASGPAEAGPDNEWPVATRACNELLSLPLYPGLADRDAQFVIDSIATFAEGGA